MTDSGRTSFNARFGDPSEEGYTPKQYALAEVNGNKTTFGRSPQERSLDIQQACLQVKTSYEKLHPRSFPGDARQTIAFIMRLCMSHPDDYNEILPLEALDNVRRASWGRPARRLPGDVRDPLMGYGAVVEAVKVARKKLLANMDFEMLPTEAILKDAEKVMSEPIDAATLAAAKAAGIALPTPSGVVPKKRGS